MKLFVIVVTTALAVGLALTTVLAAPAPALKSDADIKTLIAGQRFDEAMAAARERIAAAPKEVEGHVLLGTAMFLKARASAPKDAIPALSAADADAIVKELEIAIGLAPQRKDVYLGVIDVETAAGRDARVVEQVKRTAAQFPADPKAAASLIEYGLERQTRQDPLAGPILQAIYQGYTRQPAVVITYAQHVMSTGELRSGHGDPPDRQRAGPPEPGPPGGLRRRARIQARLRRRREAVRGRGRARSHAARRAAEVGRGAASERSEVRDGPRGPAPGRGRGRGGAPKLQMKEGGAQGPGRIARCAAALWKVLSQNPPSALDAYNMSKTFMQSGFGSQALAETQVALARDHNQVEAWVLRAEIYMRVGLDKQALESLEKAEAVFDAVNADARPAYSRDEVIAARAAAQSRLGRNEEALATYQRMGDPVRYTYQMALVNEKLGNVEEARALLTKVATTGLVPAEVEAAKSRLETETYRKKP